MLRLLSLLVIIAGAALGQCSSAPCMATLPTTTRTASISSSGYGSQAMRIEARLVNLDLAAGSNFSPIFNFGGFRLDYLTGLTNRLYIGSPDTCTACSGNSVNLGGTYTDIIVRLTRDTAGAGRFSFEVFDTETGTSLGTYVSSTISGYASGATIQAAGINVGNANATGSIAFLRVYNSAVAIGTRPQVGIASPATILDYEFNSNGNDTSGNSQNLGGAALTYADAPTYVPAVSAGELQTTRTAVGTLTLAGSCVPLDGGTTATWSWSILSQPMGASASITTASSPTSGITGMTTFGTYELEASCTDASMQTTTATVKHGSVVADANGVIDLTAEGVSSAAQSILGPVSMYNPNYFADDAHRRAIDLQIQNWATVYTPFWRTTLGTVTIVEGSATATKASGADTNAACAGGTSPSAGAVITLKFTGTDARTYYTSVAPTACTSTTMTLNWQNNGSGVYDANGLSPFPTCNPSCTMDWNWGDDTQNNWATWTFNSAPGSYYDNVKAAKLLYLRTGVDTYQDVFEEQADIWWEMPKFNQGYGCYYDIQASNTCWGEVRQWSLAGVFLRAIEEGPSSPKWDGLRVAYDNLAFRLSIIPAGGSTNLDTREASYETSYLSFCAIADPDSSERAACRTAIKDALTNIWDSATFHRADLGSSTYKGYGTFYSASGSAGSSITALGGQGTVCVTNGSTAVTGSGTAFSSGTVSGAQGAIWFWPAASAASLPASNSVGDSEYYTATYVSGTSLTLDRNYTGTTGCGKGYVFGFQGIVAWGSQAWPMGFAAMAACDASAALAGTDPTESATYKALCIEDANWVTNFGRYAGTEKGLVNGVFFPGCSSPPLSSAYQSCWPAGTSADQSRTLTQDAMRGLAKAYLASLDLTLRAEIDEMYTEMYCPSSGFTCPTGTSDTYYINSYDSDGFYMTGTPPSGTSPKWTGQLAGIQESASIWLAARLSSGTGQSTFSGNVSAIGNITIR